MQLDNHLASFTEIINEWKDGYRSITKAFLAYKVSSGYRLGYATISMGGRLPKRAETPTVRTPKVIVGIETIPFNQRNFNALMKDIAIGKLQTKHGIFTLADQQADLRSDFFLGRHPAFNAPSRQPTLIITNTHPGNINNEVNADELEIELASLKKPYDGLNDLLSSFSIPAQLTHRRIDLFANIPIEIEVNKSSLKNSILDIRLISVPQILSKKVSLGLRLPNSKGGFDRMSIESKKIKWITKSGYSYGNCSLNIKQAKYAHCILRYNHKLLTKYWIVDKEKELNHRYALYNLFDNKEGNLQKLLYPEKNTARDLELGMSLLLTTLGFRVTYYGEKGSLQDAPDLVAETPISSRIALVECTTLISDYQKKISNLKLRTQKVKQRLEELGLGHTEVISILVSNMAESVATIDREFSRDHGVINLFKENIDSLLIRLNFNTDPESLYEEAKSLLNPQQGLVS